MSGWKLRQLISASAHRRCAAKSVHRLIRIVCWLVCAEAAPTLKLASLLSWCPNLRLRTHVHWRVALPGSMPAVLVSDAAARVGIVFEPARVRVITDSAATTIFVQGLVVVQRPLTVACN